MSRRNRPEIGVVDLMDQAAHLLRQAPVAAHARYGLGTVPFLLGLSYFWSDMSRNPFAADHCGLAAAGLAALFLWMKFWHVLFADALMAHVSQRPAMRPTARQALGIFLRQSSVQPWGLLLLPLSLLFIAPFGWVHAFFQNVTVLGAADEDRPRALARRAWAQARLWPQQNHIVIWVLSPWVLGFTLLTGVLLGWFIGYFYAGFIPSTAVAFMVAAGVLALLWPCSPLGTILMANAAMVVIAVPWVAKTCLGLQTQLGLSWLHVLNGTFLIAVFGLTFLLLDPLLKAAYVLRCFYGDSRRSGEDLRVRLRAGTTPSSARRPWQVATLVALLLLPLGSDALGDAESSAPDPPAAPATAFEAEALARNIRNVMDQPRYNWRLPRQVDPAEDGDALSAWQRLLNRIDAFLQPLFKLLEPMIEWLVRHGHDRGGDGSPNRAALAFRLLLAAVIILFAVALVLLVRRLRQTRRRRPETTGDDEGSTAVDLEAADVAADQLPEDGWLQMSRELMASGDYRLAQRAIYLSILAHLGANDFIRLTRFKTDRDYERELRRRAHSLPDLLARFVDATRAFERSWYGLREVTRPALDEFIANQQRIRDLC